MLNKIRIKDINYCIDTALFALCANKNEVVLNYCIDFLQTVFPDRDVYDLIIERNKNLMQTVTKLKIGE